MKGLFAILLAAVFSLQSMQINLNDLYKISDLIEHANFHAEEYGDNWFTFLSKHYGELKEEHDAAHQEEKAEHSKLPEANQFLSFSLSFIPVNEKADLSSPIISFKELSFFYQSLYQFQSLADIFQPPRI